MTAATNTAKEWLDAGLGFLYPEACQICGQERATVADGFVGKACRRKVRFVIPPLCGRCGLAYEGDITTAFECGNCRDVELHFSTARSAVLTGELMLEVIHRYKYQHALWFEPFLAGLLVQQAAPALAVGRWDMIVPVPLHPVKRRERGFNQAERLARQLGRAAGIPVETNLLRRVVPTNTQTRLSRTERAANVKGAFALRPGRKLENSRRIVVVDDVFTTGATTNACAGALRAAGAEEVCIWTVARGF